MKIEWKCSSRSSVRIQISRSTILPVSRLSIALMLDTVPLEMDSYQVYSALCVYNDVRVKVFFLVFRLNWDVGSCASKHKYTHTHTRYEWGVVMTWYRYLLFFCIFLRLKTLLDAISVNYEWVKNVSTLAICRFISQSFETNWSVT